MEKIIPLFKQIKLLLHIDKPYFVKKAEPFLDFEELPYNDKETILMGVVKIYVETEEYCFYLDLSACQEEFTDAASKQIARESIVKYTKEYLPNEMERINPYRIWNNVDFDNKCWKKKEE